jgi:xylulokinase
VLCEGEKREAKRRGLDAYDIMTRPASKVIAGSDGLIFLPYLSGERTPYSDPYARGVFFGLGLRHTKAHMTRAVMEGVTFGLRDSLELMRQLGLRICEVGASGGGAKSPLWCQMIADIFGTNVIRLRTEEGAAFGAALLAGVGCGMFATVAQACEKGVRVRSSLRPGTTWTVRSASSAWATIRSNMNW